MQNKTKILKNVYWLPIFRVIRWTVPFLIALILYKKFYKSNSLTFEAFSLYFRSLSWQWYLFLPLMSALNWFTEIWKWRFLVNKLEAFSWKASVKSVLSGIAVSQLLPYRTGEYLGRLAFVGDSNRIDAGILSVAGSFSQLLITLAFGVPAFLIIRPLDLPFSLLISILLLLLLLQLGYYYLPRFRLLRELAFFKAIQSALSVLSRADLFRLLALSCFRYMCFLLPYAMLAAHFNLSAGSSLLYMMSAVACIYFLQTVSPNFILTDLAIRISVPALVFSGSTDYFNGIDHVPGMLIYVFNVAIPMCLGALVLLLIRLRK